MKQWAESEEPTNPYNFDVMEANKTIEPGIVNQHPISPEAELVVTEQPKSQNINEQ